MKRPHRMYLRFLPVALTAAWLMLAVFSLNNYFNVRAYAKAPNWPAVTAYLRQHVTADDLVIQLAADAAFGYYYDSPAPQDALPAYPAQPAEEIAAKLEQYSTEHRSIWLVGQTFPDWPSAGLVESWLQSRWQSVLNTQADGLKIQRYLPWEVNNAEIRPEPLAVFGDVVRLVGIEMLKPPQPEGDLTVWLYWRALTTTDAPLKVFVHLQGELNPATGSPLWTQDDDFPQQGRISTADWQPGSLYRDVYTLPLVGIPAGTYEIRIGFYDPQTNRRLRVADGDSFPIATIQFP